MKVLPHLVSEIKVVPIQQMEVMLFMNNYEFRLDPDIIRVTDNIEPIYDPGGAVNYCLDEINKLYEKENKFQLEHIRTTKPNYKFDIRLVAPLNSVSYRGLPEDIKEVVDWYTIDEYSGEIIDPSYMLYSSLVISNIDNKSVILYPKYYRRSVGTIITYDFQNDDKSLHRKAKILYLKTKIEESHVIYDSTVGVKPSYDLSYMYTLEEAVEIVRSQMN